MMQVVQGARQNRREKLSNWWFCVEYVWYAVVWTASRKKLTPHSWVVTATPDANVFQMRALLSLICESYRCPTPVGESTCHHRGLISFPTCSVMGAATSGEVTMIHALLAKKKVCLVLFAESRLFWSRGEENVNVKIGRFYWRARFYEENTQLIGHQDLRWLGKTKTKNKLFTSLVTLRKINYNLSPNLISLTSTILEHLGPVQFPRIKLQLSVDYYT